MPTLQIDGVDLAELDAEDAAILAELARRGPGRLIMPPELGVAGKPEPFTTVEVAGEARVVVRTDWLARLSLTFAEHTVDGQPFTWPTPANDQADQAQGKAA